MITSSTNGQFENLTRAEVVVVMDTGGEALEYLKKKSETFIPELIFLDINMPGMNGWEFITEYKKIPPKPDETLVIMLSTSQNPDDIQKAKSERVIRDFMTKPLTVGLLEKILNEYF